MPCLLPFSDMTYRHHKVWSRNPWIWKRRQLQTIKRSGELPLPSALCLLDVWSNTHLNTAQAVCLSPCACLHPDGSSFSGKEIYAAVRNEVFSWWLTFFAYPLTCAISTRMYIIISTRKNIVMFSRVRFPYSRERKYHSGEHFCDGIFRETDLWLFHGRTCEMRVLFRLPTPSGGLKLHSKRKSR